MRSTTNELEPEIDLSKIRELEERLDNFLVQVSDGMTIEGSAWQGYAFHALSCEEMGLGGGPPPPPVVSACCLEDGTCEEVTVAQCIADGGRVVGGSCEPNPCPSPTFTGACCVGSDCTIETEDDCTGMGGTYQGDDTTCDPNPCPTTSTGACCHEEVCDIETESDCEGSGGVYHGDGSDCDPNPCLISVPGGCCTVGVPFGSYDCGVVGAEDCDGLYLGDGSDCFGDYCCAIPGDGGCSYGYYSGAIPECCELVGGTILGVGLCGTFGGACCNIPFVGCLDGQTSLDCECNGGEYQGIGTTCAEGCL